MEFECGPIWRFRSPLERTLQSGKGRLASRARPSFGLEVRREMYDSWPCQDPFLPEHRGRVSSNRMAVEPNWRLFRNSLSSASSHTVCILLSPNFQGAVPRSTISDPELTSMRFWGAGVVWSWVTWPWWGTMARYIYPEDSFTYLRLKGDFSKSLYTFWSQTQLAINTSKDLSLFTI